MTWATENSLNSEKLVVLGHSLGSTRSSSLDLTVCQPSIRIQVSDDLPGLETNGEIGNVDGLGLTGSVGGHDTPTVGLGELNTTA